MQRIIDEPEILVTDYLRRRNRLLTIAFLQPLFPLPFDLVLTYHSVIAVLLLFLLWLTHFIPCT